MYKENQMKYLKKVIDFDKTILSSSRLKITKLICHNR